MDLAWKISDLSEWLNDPPPESPPNVSNVVRELPLWRTNLAERSPPSDLERSAVARRTERFASGVALIQSISRLKFSGCKFYALYLTEASHRG